MGSGTAGPLAEGPETADDRGDGHQPGLIQRLRLWLAAGERT